jgi:hypothetical protein
MLNPVVGMGETWIVYKATLAGVKGKSLGRFSLGWSVQSDLFAGENCKERSPSTPLTKLWTPFGDWLYMSGTFVGLWLKSSQEIGSSLSIPLLVCESEST